MAMGYNECGSRFGYARPTKKIAPNLLAAPRDLGSASWIRVGYPPPTVDAAAAPDGSMTADLLARTSTAAAYVLQAIAKAASAQRYRFSLFGQKLIGNYLAVRLQGTFPARADVVFNLNTGAIHVAAAASGAFAGASASIHALGGGWYYVELAATSDTAATITPMFSFNSGGGFIDNVDTAANSAGYAWDMKLVQP